MYVYCKSNINLRTHHIQILPQLIVKCKLRFFDKLYLGMSTSLWGPIK